METFISALQVLNAVAKQIALPTGWEGAMQALQANTHVFNSEEGDKFNVGINRFLNGLSRKQFALYFCRSEAASKLHALFHNAQGNIRCYDTRSSGQALISDAVMAKIISTLGDVAKNFDDAYRLARLGEKPFPDPLLPSKNSENIRFLSDVGFSRQQLDEFFAVRKMMNPLVGVEVDDPPLYILGSETVCDDSLQQPGVDHELINKLLQTNQILIANLQSDMPLSNGAQGDCSLPYKQAQIAGDLAGLSAASGVDGGIATKKTTVRFEMEKVDILSVRIREAIEETGSYQPAVIFDKLKEWALEERSPFTGLDNDNKKINYTDGNFTKRGINMDSLGARIRRFKKKHNL
ncbi:hypothetical protein [Vogesella sp. LIG4]|uniref:hypothetical protein n=1 Tax=Vogesella sp. LIG4 TaxID=1192162 RepID=UPI00081FA12A|nr:hypothetical protein [Vogesella sp. LIG4]SCK09208.1 hypothetical protein PSELUDRAFT_0606 [Vogesella sp. LIG4]